MNESYVIDTCMVDAVKKLDEYITRTTGEKPTQDELAQALSKYFVLKEIREFIEMNRKEESSGNSEK